MSVEEEFKHYNGYKEVQADRELINKWRQELIDRHMSLLLKEENEIWIHLSILVDLISKDEIHQQDNCAQLIKALNSLRYLPFWNILLILKPILEGDYCLLRLTKGKNYQDLVTILNRYIPTNVESEHDNFIKRYEHLKKSFEAIKREHQD